MRKVLLLLLAALACAGCVRNRLSTWDAADSRSAAREAASELLTGAWLEQFSAPNTASPVLLLASLRDQTAESAALELLSDSIEHELLASGKVRLVAPRGELPAFPDSLREAYFQQLARDAGADFLLQGELSSRADKKLRSYLLELRLLDSQKMTSVWQLRLQRAKPLKVRIKAGDRASATDSDFK